VVQYVGFFGNLGGRRAIEAEVSENTCLESNMCSRGGDCQLADDITVGRKEKGREKRTVRSSTRVWLRMNPIVCARALLQELRNMFSCMDMF